MQLYFSAVIIAAVVLWGLISPTSLAAVFDAALVTITHHFGSFYLWIVLALVSVCGLPAFSRYGNLRLGAEEDRPEFSTGAWFAMLFAAGMGRTTARPRRESPPTCRRRPTRRCATAFSIGGCTRGRSTPWSPSPSATVDSGAAVPPSTLPWRPVRQVAGLFDVLAVIAAAFGVAASLGIGALQINSGLNVVFGIPISITVHSLSSLLHRRAAIVAALKSR